jgi:hypothetical protein
MLERSQLMRGEQGRTYRARREPLEACVPSLEVGNEVNHPAGTKTATLLPANPSFG